MPTEAFLLLLTTCLGMTTWLCNGAPRVSSAILNEGKFLTKKDSVSYFKVSLHEKGRRYAELLEINKGIGVEYFHVQAHLDIDEAEFIFDFNKNMSMLKVVAKNVCYISNLEPDLPPPDALEQYMKQPSNPNEDVVKEMTEWTAARELRDRSFLSGEMRRLCKNLPVYPLAERTQDGIATVHQIFSPGRKRRANCSSKVCVWTRSCSINCVKCGLTCKTVHFFRTVRC